MNENIAVWLLRNQKGHKPKKPAPKIADGYYYDRTLGQVVSGYSGDCKSEPSAEVTDNPDLFKSLAEAAKAGQISTSDSMLGKYIDLENYEPVQPVKVPGEVNPKTIAGSKKLALSFVPASSLALINQALENGAAKYGTKNWLDTKIPARTYIDAAARHTALWFEGGQDCAEDSGIHHLAHAAASYIILLDAMLNGQLIDDRPTATKSVIDLLGGEKKDIDNPWVAK